MGALVIVALVAGLGFKPTALWLLPFVAAACFLILVNTLPLLNLLPAGPDIDIANALELKANRLRLLSILAPSRFGDVGTIEAQKIGDVTDHVRAYSDTFFGRGYLSLQAPTEVLRPVHMTDNGAAVHLVSPFGRLGAVFFAVCYGALTLAAGARALSAKAEWRPWLGFLATLSLFTISTYMILANVVAAPFTGRNVYLLAASSNSDLLEGLMLFIVAGVSLGVRVTDTPAGESS